ncbi:hypothetical protein BMF94_4207 [Rhodotorula taiwanensis]|uniref:Uncharacterized protein n=1 Tax=Rhodotorula taiwanensis TaxID=741276 RepID=A0A2S5B7Q2_9BASI|nr:hypothetical protein BMF94_4207 [Rhodotorula taiwanensis]
MPEPAQSEPATSVSPSDVAGEELATQESASHSPAQASPTETNAASEPESTGLVMSELSAVEPIKSSHLSAPLASTSGEAAHGHQASSPKSPATLEPLATGSLTELPMFAPFGSDYCFPPKPSPKRAEGSLAQNAPGRRPDAQGSLGKPAATSESESFASSGATMPLNDEYKDSEEAATPDSQSSTRRNSTSTVVPPKSASERQPRCKHGVPYATTCQCDQTCEAIAHVKKGEPVPPPPLPKLYVPRAFAELRRCPSCDRQFESLGQTRTEAERLAWVIEEHWPCLVHLMLTRRIEPAFADE